MRTAFTSAAIAASAFVGLVTAQTHSDCNPVEGDKCEPNPAFGGDASIDFMGMADAEALETYFNVDDGIVHDTGKVKQLQFDGKTGMSMVLSQETHAPLLISHDYIFFGRVEVELQAAPGAGIITSLVLQSDSLDEIDFEFVGNDQTNVQTNIFSKGVEDFTRGETHPVSFNAMDSFHKYVVDWTPERMEFSIDGNVVRTILASEGDYPQTPCELRVGTWVAGRKDAPQGTIDWAGGVADFSQGPTRAYYKGVKITDYGGGYEGAKEYVYSNSEGTWESIQVVGGKKTTQAGWDLPATDNHLVDNSGSDKDSDSKPSPKPSTGGSHKEIEISSSIPSASSAVEEIISSVSSEIESITSSAGVPAPTPGFNETGPANSTSSFITSASESVSATSVISGVESPTGDADDSDSDSDDAAESQPPAPETGNDNDNIQEGDDEPEETSMASTLLKSNAVLGLVVAAGVLMM